jgi:hypothetical protein
MRKRCLDDTTNEGHFDSRPLIADGGYRAADRFEGHNPEVRRAFWRWLCGK